ncbi:type VII secretion protein EccB [Glycomyces rhizosphaerae]|uniref:Type VII secretion protein EccB n=1 Tax=Glycomyces rhizosphaerae TaxID=2054422 RepID=A0ABV7PWV3_9ACTN
MAQMRSRREQVEAHKFITSRMNQALVLANPDSIERPLRRIGVSIFASVMVLALIFGGFAIATLFNKGNALPVEGNIITIKGTNSVYVFVTKDGTESTEDNPARLWQVTNYTSALLLAKPGSTGVPEVQDLKPSSLKDIPRGNFTIGIQGIPSQPPDPSELLQDRDWNTCSMPREDGGTAEFQLTQLVVDDLPEDQSVQLGDDHWLLAKTATKEDSQAPLKYYLLWNGGKYDIGEEGELSTRIISALGLDKDDAMPLNENMLNTIPAVAPLMPEPRTEFESTSAVMGKDGEYIQYGRPVKVGGELFVLTKQADGDEFATISPTLAKVLESGYGEQQELDPADASVIGTQGDYMADGYPDADLRDELWTSDKKRPAVCAVYDPQAQEDESTKLDIIMYDAAPEELTLPADGVEIDENGNIFSETENLAAQTVLPQGTAALADSRTAEGATISGFTYLISDQGIRHGIADEGKTDMTQTMLGYADVKPVSVPHTMINLIPKGPDLDPYEAKKQMTSNTEDVPVYETQPEEGEGG